MGLLNPWFLLAGLAVAVPVALHLFHRQDAKRVVFPAIRYLLRTEEEHARNIRFRQLVLLLVRVAAVLLLVLVGARPFLRGGGGVHEPTALVVILDNTMSSGRIAGDTRAIDLYRGAALESLERAGDRDRVWLLLAGDPWAPAVSAAPEELAGLVREAEPTAAGADVREVLSRALSLVRQSELELREIHLIGDIQASFDRLRGPLDPAEVPLLVHAAHPVGASNRYLDSLSLGDGLAPLAGERTSVVVRVDGGPDAADVPVRLIVDGRLHGAVSAPAGTRAVLPFGPFPGGWITGSVESDPDGLSADDVRYFALRVRPAPRVRTSGPASFFLENALPVLEAAGRIDTEAPEPPDVRIAVGGAGLDRSEVPTVVIPEAEATALPALNRRLAAAGIPWRYEPTTERGEVAVMSGAGLPVDLGGTRVRSAYRLRPETGADTAAVLARLATGEAWMVESRTAGGRALLLGSPFEEDASSLPVTAVVIPLLDWTLGSWSAGSRDGLSLEAGQPLPLPESARVVVDPSGRRLAVEGGRSFEETRSAGIWTVLGPADTVLNRVAVNAPASESETARLRPTDFASDADVRWIEVPDRWSGQVFVDSQGPEFGGPLLLAALLLLLVESLLAASGGPDRRERRGTAETARASTAGSRG